MNVARLSKQSICFIINQIGTRPKGITTRTRLDDLVSCHLDLSKGFFLNISSLNCEDSGWLTVIQIYCKRFVRLIGSEE